MQTSVVSAYIIGIVVFIVMLLIAAVVANAIAYQPGTNPTDPRKRKTWFWILGVLTPVLTFVLTYFIVYIGIKMKTVQDKYMTAMCISTALSFVLYVAIGFALSKIFKHGKLSSWF
jgi:drug/metabolite transporter (DMT)-like permease